MESKEVLPAKTIKQALANAPTTVGDVMTSPVTTLSPERSVSDAVSVFGECGFRHLVAVDATGRLAGVVSDRDALRAMARGHAASTTSVADVMTPGGVVARTTMPLVDAIDLVVFHRINCLPVVDDADQVCGIVTTTDLLGALHDLLHRLGQSHRR